MKIAVPTRANQVDEHFGHCEMYTVFTVSENGSITDAEMVPSPQGCGCKSDIAAVLRQKGVAVMLAGNMGMGAVNVLNTHGIQVFRGCSGEVQQVAMAYISGELTDSGESCRHLGHQHHGTCKR
jgi:predicted Fe-Mo cluster-binding NifX family protein